MADFITSIYDGEILLNNRKIIYPYELDVYLPGINIAFEFNGDFYHANPIKYKSDDIILNKTASEIWEKDKKKKLRCDKKDIKLITIWEYDWMNNRDHIEKEILNILE